MTADLSDRTTSFSQRLGVLLLAASLGACGTNPMVRWEPAAVPDDNADELDLARRDAHALKREYHGRAEALVGERKALNDGLLGLGVLTLGLVTGKAHRDAYTVTAGAAGAAYLFGNTNLQQAALDAWQAGIGSVNCALAVVEPLVVGKDGLQSASAAASGLGEPLTALAGAIAGVETQVAHADDLKTELVALARQQAAEARQSYARAQAARAEAAELAPTVRRTASGLRGALDRIHERVNLLLSRAQVDSRSLVTGSLQDLVSVVNGFGRAAGVPTLIAPPLADTTGTTTQSARDAEAPPAEPAKAKAATDAALARNTALADAVRALAAAQARVDGLSQPLIAQLAPYKSVDNAQALAQCELKATGSKLAVDEASLQFKAAAAAVQTQKVTVTGGVKPYSARLRGAAIAGLEVVRPADGSDDSFEVRVAANAAATTLTLHIRDASPVPQVALVTVTVLSTVETEPESDRDRSAGTSLRSGLERIRLDATFTRPLAASGNRYQVTGVSVSRDGSVLGVALQCLPGAARRTDTGDAIKTALLESAAVPTGERDAAKARMQLQEALECRR